jgi:hypothetical protein
MSAWGIGAREPGEHFEQQRPTMMLMTAPYFLGANCLSLRQPFVAIL